MAIRRIASAASVTAAKNFHADSAPPVAGIELASVRGPIFGAALFLRDREGMRDEFYFMNSRAHPRISTLRGFPRLRKFRHFWYCAVRRAMLVSANKRRN